MPKWTKVEIDEEGEYDVLENYTKIQKIKKGHKREVEETFKKPIRRTPRLDKQ